MSAKSKDSGHAEHSRLGMPKFAAPWTVFGSCLKTAAKVDPAALAACPKSLTVGGKRLKPQTVTCHKNGVADLSTLPGFN